MGTSALNENELRILGEKFDNPALPAEKLARELRRDRNRYQPLILAALRYGGFIARMKAADILGLLMVNTPEAISCLSAACADPNPDVSASAKEALARITYDPAAEKNAELEEAGKRFDQLTVAEDLLEIIRPAGDPKAQAIGKLLLGTYGSWPDIRIMQTAKRVAKGNANKSKVIAAWKNVDEKLYICQAQTAADEYPYLYFYISASWDSFFEHVQAGPRQGHGATCCIEWHRSPQEQLFPFVVKEIQLWIS